MDIRRLATVVVVGGLIAGVIGAQERPVLDVDAVRVRVTPELGFVLPYGIIVQQARLDVGRSTIGTVAEFNLPDNGVAGEVNAVRRFGKWEPRARAYQELVSDALATTRLSEGQLFTTPDDEFVSRLRGVAGSLRYYVNEDLHIGAGSTFVERLETRFGSEQDNGESDAREFLVTPSLAVTISSLVVQNPLDSSIIRGAYARFEVAQQYDGDDMTPIVATARISSLWYHEPAERLNLELQASATTPLRVWDEARFVPPIIGGFDTVRGFDRGYLAETRGVLLRNTVTWNPARALEAGFATPVIGTDEKISIRFSDARLLSALDVALVQRAIRWTGDVDAVFGAGPGVAVTISVGPTVHFDIRSFVVWPVGVADTPVFYLQGSLFTISP